MSFIEEKKESAVWQHFLHSKELELAKCKICKADIKCKGGSTSSMRSHLKAKHNLEIPSKPEVVKKKETPSINEFFHVAKDPLAVVVTELIACDGIPIRVLETSHRLRAALKAQGYSLPSDDKGIKAIMMKHFQEIKSRLKEQFEKFKANCTYI